MSTSTPAALGLRLVKKTVNQDDVSAYHLFYADALGSPGTDITFFDWPAPHEVPRHQQHRADRLQGRGRRQPCAGGTRA
jgi:catechol 2,3-dioxygenase-like lactoylglutathione lyase family enzyme